MRLHLTALAHQKWQADEKLPMSDQNFNGMTRGCVKFIGTIWLLACFTMQELAAVTPPNNTVLPEVTVSTQLTDTEARRDFVAGKIIIGRKRIEESGLQYAADLLEREPSVTVSKDGRIGLLGLPGYTQILVDGAPPSAGKALHELDLVHVERIEIVKSAVAEFGPFGIAGTINVVTRQVQRKDDTQARLGTNSTGGKIGTSAAWTINRNEADSPWRFNAQLSASKGLSASEVESILTSVKQGQLIQTLSQSHTEEHQVGSSWSTTGGVQWRVDTRNQLIFTPSADALTSEQHLLEQRDWTQVDHLNVTEDKKSSLAMLSWPLKWTFQIDDQSMLEAAFLAKRVRLNLNGSRGELPPGEAPIQRRSEQRNHNRSENLKVDYKTTLDSSHNLKVGVNLGESRSDGEYRYWINNQPDASLAVLGVDSHVSSKSLRAFIQDSWRTNDLVAFNFGLSGETQVLDTAEGTTRNQAQYRMWSPSAHWAYKLDEDGTEQWRIGIARTYKVPWQDQLLLRPSINPVAQCNGSGMCTANTVDTADTAGNPALQPERAWGLNISYEYGFGKNSQIALEWYARAIDGLIGADIQQESVVWANVPRYVARPANLGQALVFGMDLEVELHVRELLPDAPKLEVRGSLGLAHSRVSTLPEPNNRLAEQTPWRAKLGVSYTVKDWPLKLTMDANYAPSGWVRLNTTQALYSTQKASLSASASWRISGDMRLVLNLDNLLAQTKQRISEYTNQDELLYLRTASTSQPKLGALLEIKL